MMIFIIKHLHFTSRDRDKMSEDDEMNDQCANTRLMIAEWDCVSCDLYICEKVHVTLSVCSQWTADLVQMFKAGFSLLHHHQFGIRDKNKV